jgi:sugar phosphate isomerase/epimerase
MRPMTSRRAFLQTLTTPFVAKAAAPLGAWAVSASAAAALKHPLTGELGLQLYSLRHLFKKDVAGTLELIRSWGFTNVEAGNYGPSLPEFAAMLKRAGLKAVGTGADYKRLTGDVPGIIADARTLGATYVMCAWIPHDKGFTLADAEKAVPVFNEAGKQMRAAGLRFCYHVHGYEFQPGPDGTLFDSIARRTDPDAVAFEMDVFWVVHGGGRPVELFEKYPKRFPLTHLKDMREGTVGNATGHAPDETSVPLGQGTIDWPTLLKAANKAGVEHHFIEDEHPEAEKQIPETLEYLAALKLD